MLKTQQLGDVLSLSSGKEVGGQVLYWVNFYFYRGIVIDTGCPHTENEVRSFFEKREVKAVLLTHYHEDHIGGANAFDTSVFAPEKSLYILKNPPVIPKYRQIVWGQPEPVLAEPLKETMNFDDVEIRVIETPGHSFDHVCFLIDDKLFSGDLIVSTKQIVSMKEEDYVTTIESLKRVLKLNFERAYGGPGSVTKEEAKEYLDYLVELKKRVEELHSEGKSIKEIVDTVFPNPPAKAILMEQWSEMEWARENLVRSLLGKVRD
jgi:glyoxylase-like metal-dependent hydrolase (beta-lactamase superfamily II)